MNLTPAKVTMMMLVAVGGLIGLYVVKGLFAVQKPTAPRPRIVTVPLATGDISPGTKITDTHVGLGQYLEGELKEDHLRSTRVIVGRVAKKQIKSGDPIRGIELYEPGENVPLTVSAGKKAVSIALKESSEFVDGLIHPGEFVDVHFRLDAQRATGVDDRLARLGGVSMTLFKGVKILAVNKGFRQAAILPTGNSVTLELSPAQTNVLLVAQPNGLISFSFSPDGAGDGDVALNNADRVTLWEILGLRKRVREPKEEPEQPFITETYRGTTSGNVAEWNKDGKKYDRAAANAAVNVDDADRAKDDVTPDDVFTNPGQRSGRDSNSDDAVPPSADPDIPTTQPGTAGGGVRSRVGSMLRARPQSNKSQVGPTALRD